MSKTNEFQKLFKVQDVADILELSISGVYNLIQRGGLPTLKIGKSYRIKPSELPCLGCSVPIIEHLAYQIIQPFVLIYSFLTDFLRSQKAFLFEGGEIACRCFPGH